MARQKTSPDLALSVSERQIVVDRRQSGERSREDSLSTFEQGIRLSRECQSALTQAEQKVQLLLERNGEVEETPFSTDDQA